MTLSRSMSIKLAALVAGIVLLGGTAVWQLRELAADVDAALAAHDRWQRVYARAVTEVGTSLIIARNVLRIDEPRLDVAIHQLKQATAGLNALDLPADASDAASQARAQTLRVMRRTVDQLQTLPAGAPVQRLESMSAELDAAYGLMAGLEAEMRRALEAVRDAAQRRADATVIAVSALAVAVALGAIVIGLWQHRSVMGPVRRVAAGVRRIAAGRFDQRLDTTGHDELAALAHDFNGMTRQLDELYHRLEQKVAQQSRELVRSERLASVGYLAAGVAHEINNPLAIIAGHAELALLKQEALDDKTCDALQVICDEAFRCKQITGRLLSLARGQDEARRTVRLRDVGAEVVKMVADLPKHRGRTLELAIDADQPLAVHAVEAEMKQVVLNVVINALEATPADSGRVSIGGRRVADRVRLTISDNGRGMDQSTLARVFEPFYTGRRGAGEPGTGLGLSICHAIIADHGGTITAASAGAGRGSTFTIDLPADADAAPSSPGG